MNCHICGKRPVTHLLFDTVINKKMEVCSVCYKELMENEPSKEITYEEMKKHTKEAK